VADVARREGMPTVGALRRLVESESVTAYVLLIPTLAGLVFFTLGPVVAAFLISFTKWDLTSSPVWVGLGNYDAMVNLDPLSRISFVNTVVYVVVTVPVGISLSLLLAAAMNQKIRGIVLYRTAYFLPVISSTVAISLLWQWLYHPEYGLLNYLLALVGLPPSRWLDDPSTALPAIMVVSVWRGLGFNMVILLAGLQSIPQELYDAAAIDGASAPASFRHVTIPMLTPTIFFVAVLSVISSFQVFDQTYVMTKGGPLNATTTIVFYIFRQAFEWFHMGYASALGYVLFAVILAFTLLQFRIQKSWVHYE
jgi:multiple sugar transport system permease protein